MTGFKINFEVVEMPDLKSDFPEKAMQDVLFASANYAREQWKSLISTGIPFVSDKFIRGITRPKLVETNEIDITSRGVKPYDLKPIVLKGAESKVIPFRWVTQKVGQKSFGMEQRNITSLTKPRLLPREVANVAKNFLFRGESIEGLMKLSKTPLAKQTVGQHKQKQTGAYSWSSLLTGMTKDESGQFKTFRTMKADGQEGMWMHPGFPSDLYFEQVVRRTEIFVNSLVDQVSMAISRNWGTK